MIPLVKVVLNSQEINAVTQILKSGQLTQGKKVAEFEEKFAKFCRVKYALAVNSGTAALHCALYALGIKTGDEVITTPFTYVATANSILMVGAKPVFADIDEKTYNLDPEKLETAITRKTRAVIAVNLFGLPADYQKINKIAGKHNLFVIEDAAQSINARYKNKRSGNLADISCFSFYATKNIISGEGGMVTTNNKKIFERARRFRQHGEEPGKKYIYFDLGYNYRMTDISAALGLAQLNKVEKITKKRQNIAKLYDRALHKIKEIRLNKTDNDRTHVYHQYTMRVENRDQLKKFLGRKGIQTNIYYPIPLYNFKHLSSNKSSVKFPVAEKVSKEVLSIPVHPLLTKNEVKYIIKSIQSHYHDY